MTKETMHVKLYYINLYYINLYGHSTPLKDMQISSINLVLVSCGIIVRWTTTSEQMYTSD